MKAQTFANLNPVPSKALLEMIHLLIEIFKSI